MLLRCLSVCVCLCVCVCVCVCVLRYLADVVVLQFLAAICRAADTEHTAHNSAAFTIHSLSQSLDVQTPALL